MSHRQHVLYIYMLCRNKPTYVHLYFHAPHFVKVSNSVLKLSSSLIAEKSELKLISGTTPPVSPPTFPAGIREELFVKGSREEEEEEASLDAAESSSIERMDGGTR